MTPLTITLTVITIALFIFLRYIEVKEDLVFNTKHERTLNILKVLDVLLVCLIGGIIILSDLV